MSKHVHAIKIDDIPSTTMCYVPIFYLVHTNPVI